MTRLRLGYGSRVRSAPTWYRYEQAQSHAHHASSFNVPEYRQALAVRAVGVGHFAAPMSRSPTYTRSMSISHDMGFMPINNPRAGISTAETLAEMPNLGDDLAKSWKRMQISRSRNQDGKQENTCQVLDWDLSAGQIVRHIERSLGTSLVINSNLIVGDMRPMGNIRISPVTLSPPDGYFCVGPSVLVTPASHLFAPPLPTTSEAGEADASAYDRAVEAATAASLSAPTTANPFTDPSVALVTAPDNSAVSGAIKAVATLYLRHSSADPDDLSCNGCISKVKVLQRIARRQLERVHRGQIVPSTLKKPQLRQLWLPPSPAATQIGSL